jgi:hypothetical protein
MAWRRKRNRKRNVHAGVRFPSYLAAGLVFIALAAIGYLWLEGRCDALGKDILRLEQQQQQAHRRRLNEELKWSNLKSPASMERLLKKYDINMVWPEESCIIRSRGSAPAGPRQFAHQAGASVND